MINTENLVQEIATVKDALTAINNSDHKIVFVVDGNNCLLGSITDGDIRRGLLAGANTESAVTEVMNKEFDHLREGVLESKKIKELKEKRIHLVPIINEDGALTRMIDVKDFLGMLPLDAVIQAGGEGRRLLPFTLDTPKPLLKVGDKPIIEYNIDRLKKFGIKNVTISIKYLKNQIRDYFGDGSEKGLNINYVEEKKALGTAGAVSLVPNFEKDYILMMNSDLLTDIDYGEMFELLLSTGAEMAVATFPYEVDIPYGVVETEGDVITSLNEKPNYTYYSNAGIYMFKKECVDLIPKDTFFHATDLMESLMTSGKKVIHFPIRSYWLDIGKPRDFEQAQEDIKKLRL